MKVQDPLFKIVENFKMVKTEHKSSVRPFWTPVWLPLLHACTANLYNRLSACVFPPWEEGAIGFCSLNVKETRSLQTGSQVIHGNNIGPEAWREGNHSKHHTHFTNAESRLKMPHDEAKPHSGSALGLSLMLKPSGAKAPFLPLSHTKLWAQEEAGTAHRYVQFKWKQKQDLNTGRIIYQNIHSLSMPCSYKNGRWPLSLSKRSPLEGAWVRPGSWGQIV